MHPEPFNTTLDEFLAGPDGGELDVDPIFAKSFDQVMDEFARHAPEDLAPSAEVNDTPSMVAPGLHYRTVPAGVLLMDGERPVGGYLSCDLSLDAEYQGRGLGAEIVIERCLREGASPVWPLDAPAYSPAGLEAHRAAWERATGRPDETRMRLAHIGGEKPMGEHVKTIVRTGGALFDIEVAPPRDARPGHAAMPGVFNLRFRYNGEDAEALSGGGVYAIYFRGELLYVGIYTGDRKTPFAGNVARDRFSKHLEALTMRGRNIGFSPANYDESIRLPGSPLVAALRSSTEPRGRGAVRTYPCKVAFAAENWHIMAGIERRRDALDDFVFLYGRVTPASFRVHPSYADLKNYINVIEDDIILMHRPRCNERFTRSDRSKLLAGPPEQAWECFKDKIDELRHAKAIAA